MTKKQTRSDPVLFLVGRVNDENKAFAVMGMPAHHQWEVRGIFDSEEEAKSHCTSWYDFYGPLRLNELRSLEEISRKWVGCRYPVAEDYSSLWPQW